ncbi:outer membrane beta-barrel protein [Neiella marina]|uniref:Outer membrane beta-barrel protein n=1 Tax=Neiella holothuriorum TaxID=2870530 RepID=A0ABS7EJ72_9GAMM|nr:outer membrane beta-barrel protein [Neiella holothuriorum]MBW8192396.1 outer membrane beta-barrel protein [Neiella holothuriorum]
MKLFRVSAIALACSLLSYTSTIVAEEAEFQPTIDVSILAGTSGSSSFESLDKDDYTLDTDSGTNFAVSFNYLQRYLNGSRLQYELYLAQTETDLVIKDAASNDKTTSPMDIQYFHIGGVNEVETDNSDFVPYLGASIGATAFKPDDYDSETEFSLGINAGVKWFATESMGARLDLRAIGTVIDSDSKIFCNGGCIATVDGSMWWQYQAAVGFFARF